MKQQICAGGFLIKDDKFLFGKRSETKSWAPGLWDIVGGHAKKNETPFDALKRETLEEINIEVINAELITITDVPDERANNFFKYYIYIITDWKGEVINSSDEHTALQWFTRSELNSIDIALPEYLSMIDTSISI